MTSTCSNTTVAPFAGEVARPYWQTLVETAKKHAVAGNFFLGESSQANSSQAVKVEQYLALFSQGVQGCEAFGMHLGRAVRLGTFPVLGMTLLSCHNLQQVLAQILRYEGLNHDLGVSTLILGSSNCRYIWAPNYLYLPDLQGEVSFQLALSIFAGIQTFSPLLVQQTIPVECVGFTIEKPTNVEVYRDFFQADVLFGQADNFIDFKSSILNQVVVGGDVASFSALTSYADGLLGQSSENAIVSQLQHILPSALRCHQFRVADLAGELNISVRSLQRQLKGAGTKFQRVLDDARRDLAKYYLLEKKLPMSEIAFLVGYQEQSSFNHAFKGWTGVSPKRFVV
jgi:AraC-like DNA-binding protein